MHRLQTRVVKLLSLGVPLVLTLGLSMTSAPGQSSVSTPEGKIPLLNPFARGLERAVGANHLARRIGESQIRKALTKKATGDFRIRLTPYSASDLANGIARRLDIKADKVVYDQSLHFSHAEFHSDPATPLWINLKSGKLKAPLDAQLELTLTDDDIRDTLASDALRKTLSHIPVRLGFAKQIVRVDQPRVALLAGAVHVTALVNSADPAESHAAYPVDITSGVVPDSATGLVKLVRITPSPSQDDDNALANPGMSLTFAQLALRAFLKPAKILPFPKGSTLTVQSVSLTPGKVILTAHVHILPKHPS